MYTILIIDDIEDNLVLLSSILKREGFKTLTADNGPEGRALAEKERPHLILLDLIMPKEDGFTTNALLKENMETQNIPVIFISTDNAIESKVSVLNNGGVDYITKPFRREELLARIRIHIRLSAARDEKIKRQISQLKEFSEAQKSILTDPGTITGARTAVIYEPLNESGGDFYEIMELADNIHAYFCADISGHNLSSVLTASALKALIQQNSSIMYSPGEIMLNVNQILNRILADDQFVSLVFLYLNRNTSKLILHNAGHPYPVIMKADGSIEVIEKRGHMLGINDNPEITSVELDVEKNDRIFLFTDGLIDIGQTSTENPVTYSDLKDVIRKSKDADPGRELESIVREIEQLTKSDPDDDMMIMSITV